MADGTTKVAKNIVNAAQKSNQSNFRPTLRRYIEKLMIFIIVNRYIKRGQSQHKRIYICDHVKHFNF